MDFFFFFLFNRHSSSVTKNSSHSKIISSLLLAGIYTVPLELIAKVRAYVATLRYLHNKVALIPSRHTKQI